MFRPVSSGTVWLAEHKDTSTGVRYAGALFTATKDPLEAIQFVTKLACEEWIAAVQLRETYHATEHVFL